MTDEFVRSAPRRPWHLWLVGVLGLLWNAMGAFDYLMTQTRNEGYMGQFTPEQLEYFYAFPTWVVAFWALAVWGGVLGALLLLLGKRLSVPVLLGSFLAMVVTSFHNYVLTDGMAVTGALGMAFSVVIFAAALGMWMYARAMTRRGVLA